MSRRTIATLQGPEGSGLAARVVRDTEWDEFLVLLLRDGQQVCPGATYHTEEREDALATAPAMLAQAARVAQTPLFPGALDALQAFAKAHGKAWRERLRDGWYRAHYDRVTSNHGAALQSLRNHPAYGPGSSWLDLFTLPEGAQ